MEPEGEEAAFLAEESGDTASSDPEDTAETETETQMDQLPIEEQETTEYRYREQRTGECGNRRNGAW